MATIQHSNIEAWFRGRTPTVSGVILPDLPTNSGPETLDAYQEGTWTPVLTFSNPGDLAVTYAQQLGNFTVVGQKAHFDFYVMTSSFTWSSSTGTVELTGIQAELAGSAGKIATGAMAWSGVTKTNYTEIVPIHNGGQQYLGFQASGSGQATATLQAADLPSGGTVVLIGEIEYLL